MFAPERLKALIESKIPDSSCEVTDLTGTQDHYAVYITSPVFAGKKLIEQHRLVYAAVSDHMHSDIHALTIKTDTP